MNIFVTDPCPKKSAKYLDNKRVVKMVLECAQLMSTALHEYKARSPYKPTHRNHPCTKWVIESRENYKWVLDHFIALTEEYTKRYGKIHKCAGYMSMFISGMDKLPNKPRTPFVNCARNKSLGIDYTEENNVYTAYQLYLNDRWDNDKLEPKWS